MDPDKKKKEKLIQSDLKCFLLSFQMCRENWGENHHSPQHKCQCIFFVCKIYLFDWEKHSCLKRAYIANGHLFSCWQSHKTTKSEDEHANEGRQKRT